MLGRKEKEPIAPEEPLRTDTISSTASGDAIPVEKGDIGGLLVERLQAWKHAVGYLEAYVTSTERVHKDLAKEYEKVLKTVSEPLKQGNHFDQEVGGIASLFENLRTNTQAISHSHVETEKALKSTVVPILERLHQEIKDRAKAVRAAADKGAKAVHKARNHTQNHIELLGQNSSSFDSVGSPMHHSSGGIHIHVPGTHSHTTGGKPKPENDPYVLKRGVLHRLQKQVIEENNNRQEMLNVQNQMQQFEAHILQTIQQAMAQFYQHIGAQADREKALYGDIVGATQRVPLDFEWNGFLKRNADTLIDPSAPARSVDQIQFPNQTHKSTESLMEGTLQRKGKIMRSYSAGYYVVTPSKYLHEFKDNDNFCRDPTPETSLYLPDCAIGALSQAPEGKFIISGKESGGALKGFTKHDFAFKANSHAEGAKWHEAISKCAGLTTNETPITSPITPTNGNSEMTGLPPPTYSRSSTQESGVTAPKASGEGTLPVANETPAAAPVTNGSSSAAAAVPIAPVATKV